MANDPTERSTRENRHVSLTFDRLHVGNVWEMQTAGGQVCPKFLQVFDLTYLLNQQDVRTDGEDGTAQGALLGLGFWVIGAPVALNHSIGLQIIMQIVGGNTQRICRQ